MTNREEFIRIRELLSASIIGQETVVERLLIALLANGNVLMEGLPGTAKTRSIKTLSKLIESEFSRVQFTPDLLPSDVTGSEIYREQNGTFEFQPGPIFGNLILADEINRAPAKVQAALLEAMEERQVTVSGKTHKLPELFIVLATQNPIEQEGTYPLPEAQMDRFLLHVLVPHPSDENELKILRLVRGEEAEGAEKSCSDQSTHPTGAPSSLPQSVVFDARREVLSVKTTDSIDQYMVDLIGATRSPDRYGEELKHWIRIGVSPRGTLALDRASRAHAWLNDRAHVAPEDVRAVAHDCLRHRLGLSYEANAEGVSVDDVIDQILKLVAIA